MECKLLLLAGTFRNVITYESNFRAARFSASYGDTEVDHYVGEKFEWKCEAGILPGSTWGSGMPQSIQIRFNAPDRFLHNNVYESESKYVGCTWYPATNTEYYNSYWWGITDAFGLDWEKITAGTCKDTTDTLFVRGNITKNMAELFSNYRCEVWWDITSWHLVNSKSFSTTRIQSLTPLKETPRDVQMSFQGRVIENNEFSVKCTSQDGVPPSSYVYEIMRDGVVVDRNVYGNFTTKVEDRDGLTVRCRDVNHLNHPRPEDIQRQSSFVPIHFGYRSNETNTEINATTYNNLTLSCVEGIAVDDIYDIGCYWSRNGTALHTGYSVYNITLLRRVGGIIDVIEVNAKYKGINYYYIKGPKNLTYTWKVHWEDTSNSFSRVGKSSGGLSKPNVIMIVVTAIFVIGAAVSLIVFSYQSRRSDGGAAVKADEASLKFSKPNDESLGQFSIIHNDGPAKTENNSVSNTHNVHFMPGTIYHEGSPTSSTAQKLAAMKSKSATSVPDEKSKSKSDIPSNPSKSQPTKMKGADSGTEKNLGESEKQLPQKTAQKHNPKKSPTSLNSKNIKTKQTQRKSIASISSSISRISKKKDRSKSTASIEDTKSKKKKEN